MKIHISLFFIFLAVHSIAQKDTSVKALGKNIVLSEVVVRSDLDVQSFLLRVKDDTSFYKAFRNLRILGFSALNDIRMVDRHGRIDASLHSRTRQKREIGCRSMDVLEEKSTGDFYDKKGNYNYYTAGLYASLFFTSGKVCGETNIVAGIERDVQNKSGIEKHKEQLKMLFFNPGKKIPGIPFIGDKVDIFDPDIAKYYNFSIDLVDLNGTECYLFKILPKSDLSSNERNKIVFDNITTWFHAETMEIMARNYDLSYDTPAYDFNVHMEVKMTKFKDLLVPEVLVYNGNWKVALKKRERGIFTATLFDFKD